MPHPNCTSCNLDTSYIAQGTPARLYRFLCHLAVSFPQVEILLAMHVFNPIVNDYISPSHFGVLILINLRTNSIILTHTVYSDFSKYINQQTHLSRFSSLDQVIQDFKLLGINHSNLKSILNAYQQLKSTNEVAAILVFHLLNVYTITQILKVHGFHRSPYLE